MVKAQQGGIGWGKHTITLGDLNAGL